MDKDLQMVFMCGYLSEIKTSVLKAALLSDKSTKEVLRNIIVEEIDKTLNTVYAESPKLNDDQVKNLKDLWEREHREGK